MIGLIAITTDFGDLYPGIMKGVIASISDDIRIIDITNSIPPGDIVQGAFVLRYASTYFPRGTTHLAVVDPAVGSGRRAIIILGEQYSFVGPDNGLLILAAQAQGRYRVYEIAAPNFYRGEVSPVFHGRDIFAPAAAFIASGEPVPGLREIFDPVELDLGVPTQDENGVRGRTIYVDSFGNLVTNIGSETVLELLSPGEAVEVNGAQATFVNTYSDGEKGDLLMLIGSHGMAEIAVNGDSAAAYIGIRAGDKIRIVAQKR
ncbi:MAG TPA: SAM-dependent chlorinase/fluorinase [Methanocella sp.]|nr:SAM-dependent chlorinase/fluorinase [Methanocella sp.]